MASFATIGLALLVIVFAATLFYFHWRDWYDLRTREFASTEAGDRERRYRKRRLRRRLQTSGMVGLVGLGMLGAVSLRALGASPLWIISVWSGILILLVWIMLLAVADITETQRHFGRLRQDVLLEQTRFLARARQMMQRSAESPSAEEQTQSGNGRPGRSQ